ncbi:MAG: PD-(D/E)XK nuclease family protein, partial [Candidatus Omnitrophica bacterium]|nr:PD-(D/E)XK nuclease family protein [Candidatus Omnitrophota bacterium]
KEEEEEHYGISDFLEFFEDIPESKLFISFSGENAVKLLTIHKSKGLDFRVVILPFLEMDIATMGSRAKKVKSSYIVYDSDVISGAGNDSKIGLLRLDKKYVKFSKHLKNIYHREYLRAFVDELNTLYVSFTRAKDELYLFVPNAQSKKNNIAKMFIPDEFMERGEKHNCAVFEKENTERIIPIPVPNYKRWIPFLREEFINEEHIKNRKQIEAGNFMHAILSQIHNLNDDNFKQTLDLAFGFAKNKNPYFTKINEVSKLISGLLSSYEVKPFFYIDESKDTVYREKELVNAFGHTKRIDRIIVRHDRVQVLDFKSAGTVKEEFKAQVKEYMRLISEIYPGKKVEGYILLLESQKVEKINE